MVDEILTIKDVAKYLKMNERTIYKLSQEGRIPTFKVGAQWRFKKEHIDDWVLQQEKRYDSTHLGVELSLGDMNNNHLEHIEKRAGDQARKIEHLIPKGGIALNLAATDKGGILLELVDLLARTAPLKSKERLLAAIREREDLCSTGIEQGVAFPHPRRPSQDLIDAPVIIFGRAPAGVDFGSLDEEPTRYFFLICTPDVKVHLQVLARLSRLVRDPHFRASLEKANAPEDVLSLIVQQEKKLEK